MGLVASLARPAAISRASTLSAVETNAKRLELLTELVPQARAIALLVNPNAWNAEPTIRDAQEAGARRGCSS